MNAQPIRLKKKGDAGFEIAWSDGHASVYSAAQLRKECRCAACVDETTGEKNLDPASIPDALAIVRADLTGNYAITFAFSDGHGSGIYSFETLRAICPCCQKAARA